MAEMRSAATPVRNLCEPATNAKLLLITKMLKLVDQLINSNSLQLRSTVNPQTLKYGYVSSGFTMPNHGHLGGRKVLANHDRFKRILKRHHERLVKLILLWIRTNNGDSVFLLRGPVMVLPVVQASRIVLRRSLPLDDLVNAVSTNSIQGDTEHAALVKVVHPALHSLSFAPLSSAFIFDATNQRRLIKYQTRAGVLLRILIPHSCASPTQMEQTSLCNFFPWIAIQGEAPDARVSS
jgi:hypothetical protein